MLENKAEFENTYMVANVLENWSNEKQYQKRDSHIMIIQAISILPGLLGTRKAQLFTTQVKVLK